MAADVLVLGAGMVGTSTALQLARRGLSVALVDRREPGRETSYGNAGILQRDAMEPYGFPRQWGKLLEAGLRRGIDVYYQFGALPAVLPRLARYWWHSAPARYAPIAQAYGALIRHCLDEHAPLIAEAGAAGLVRKEGYRFGFRSQAALDVAARAAETAAQRLGLRMAVQDSAALAHAEPGLRLPLAGALHWQDPWSVSDPGTLVARYAQAFVARGGHLTVGDAASLEPDGAGWRVQVRGGVLTARHAVIALGPWAAGLTTRLGYRLPLFVKRGYHRHYTGGPGLRLSLMDAERGYVLVPMAQGLRLTTGAEFARLDAAATPVQLQRAEVAARELLELPHPVESEPWLGNRPCTVDMLPVMGPAPRHAGLWFNFGHAHQGFTLGPVAGRLLAELLTGQAPFVDPAPYAATRFAGI